jgi:15-cis-phytoene synthase
MQDVFAYCAELVRETNRDRYLASLFAPEQHRGALHALYAFDSEIARVRDLAREAMPGEIRLQWWREVLGGERGGEAAANPVAAALLATIDRNRVPVGDLIALIEAHHFDLYDDPMATIAELEDYLVKTSSAVIACAAGILGADAAVAARPAGIALGLLGTLRSFPLLAARRQLYVPAEILERHDADANEIFAGDSSAALDAVLSELRRRERDALGAAQPALNTLPRETLPSFLPVAVVRCSLDLLEKCDAFAPADLPPWRRQWLIWRAARDPARVAR